MSDATIRKLTHTPLRDLVRGRITGRTDVMRHVDAATDLPAPARDLIKRVVRLSRLWSLEKADVADELIAHFRNGMEAGESADDLIASFGDERQAARLIRRAKKRNRPLAWHVLRGVGWLLAALLVFYIGLAIVFFAGSPSPSVDYVAVLNEPILQTPEDERAWPLYREAILDLGFTRLPKHERERWLDTIAARPSDEVWPNLVRLLDEHRSALKTVQLAADRPVLGYVLGSEGSGNDLELWPDVQTSEDGTLSGVVARHLWPMRNLATLLAADAHIAAEEGDAEGFLRDVEAMLNMARQLRAEPLLISDLVGVGIGVMAVDRIKHVIVRRPELLSDARLQRLAHRLADSQTAADLLGLAGTRMYVYDAVQRVYTDDGEGGGRLTPEGLRYMTRFSQSVGPTLLNDDVVLGTIGPASLVVSADRRELIKEYDRYMAQVEAQLVRPMREADWDALAAQVHQWQAPTASAMRYVALSALAPVLSNAHGTAERYLGQRDGVLVGIALELYRREHGAYPESLDALTPALLPSVPADRITGEPLRYRLIDGRPVVYSVGADRDDDGGRVPVSHDGVPQEFAAARWDVEADDVRDGDWVVLGGEVAE